MPSPSPIVQNFLLSEFPFSRHDKDFGPHNFPLRACSILMTPNYCLRSPIGLQPYPPPPHHPPPPPPYTHFMRPDSPFPQPSSLQNVNKCSDKGLPTNSSPDGGAPPTPRPPTTISVPPLPALRLEADTRPRATAVTRDHAASSEPPLLPSSSTWPPRRPVP